MKLSRRTIFIIVLIVINIVIDQISKFWVRANVIPRTDTQPSERISLIGDSFTMMNVENAGAFLGLGSDLNPTLRLILLLILPIVVLTLVMRHILKDKDMDQWSLIGFCCVIGGGIANVYDRIVYGSVTDFLYIDLGGVFKTGIFNLADVSVTTGMVLLLIGAIVHRKKNKEA